MTLETDPAGSDSSHNKLDIQPLTSVSNVKWLMVPVKSIDNYFEIESDKILHCIL